MREVAAVGGMGGIGDDAVGINALHIGELAAAVSSEIFFGKLLASGWTQHRVLLGGGKMGAPPPRKRLMAIWLTRRLQNADPAHPFRRPPRPAPPPHAPRRRAR